MKILLVALLALLYGGYSLLSTMWSSAQEVQKAESTSAISALASGLTTATSAALSAALNTKVVDIPSIGCTRSLLTPYQLQSLVASLPEAQQGPLLQLISTGDAMWSAQFYQGPLGIGICVPSSGKLIVLPYNVDTLPPTVTELLQAQ